MEQQGAFQVERFQEAVQELTQAKADLLVEEAQAILAAAEAEKGPRRPLVGALSARNLRTHKVAKNRVQEFSILSM